MALYVTSDNVTANSYVHSFGRPASMFALVILSTFADVFIAILTFNIGLSVAENY